MAIDRAKLESSSPRPNPRNPILEAIRRPAERKLEWHEYREIFLKSERIEAGAAFWKENAIRIATNQ